MNTGLGCGHRSNNDTSLFKTLKRNALKMNGCNAKDVVLDIWVGRHVLGENAPSLLQGPVLRRNDWRYPRQRTPRIFVVCEP